MSYNSTIFETGHSNPDYFLRLWQFSIYPVLSYYYY